MSKMRNTLAWSIYIVVQILFIPLAIAGGLWVVYRQVLVSKRIGVSQTAIEVVNARWTADRFGLRKDPATVRLARVLPNDSLFGLWLALFPLFLLHKMTGQHLIYPILPEPGKEGMADLIIGRTPYFDRIIDKHKGRVEQFVVLGAGMDTRAYGELKQLPLAFFEVDRANTQILKRSSLQLARIDTAHVRFLEVDFGVNDWFKMLEAAGFDAQKKTIFLWEGVSLYLSEAEVRRTLRTLKTSASAGSVLVADFYSVSHLKPRNSRLLKWTTSTLDSTKERLGFGLDLAGDARQTLASFVAGEGLTLGDAYVLGEKSKGGTFSAVAEIEI